MIKIERGVPPHLPISPADSVTVNEAINDSTEVWTGYAGNEVACIIGLRGPTLLSDRAYLWLYHTDAVEDHKFLFIRYSRIWLAEALKRYSELWGIAVLDNEAGIRWLRWLGAEFDPPERAYARFTIKAK